jgi:hypothetical protein
MTKTLGWLVACGLAGCAGTKGGATAPSGPPDVASEGDTIVAGEPNPDPAAGDGTGQGFGSGVGRISGSHRTKPPQVQMGSPEVSGRLEREVIQRIVHQSFDDIRTCYDAGLRGNPNLQGRLLVRFVIGRDGAASKIESGSSDMSDRRVVACVGRAFEHLSFPQPDRGIVTVTYPIMFAPGS